MHPCLEVGELLHLILSLIYDDLSTRQSQQGLLAVGLTCRLFLEAAMDLMWHTQSSFVPLIKTLPRKLWMDTPSRGFDRTFQLVLTKPLTESDLTRFRFYAHRVRTVNYVPYPWHGTVKSSANAILLMRYDNFESIEVSNKDSKSKKTQKPKPLALTQKFKPTLTQNPKPALPSSPILRTPNFNVADLNILFYIWRSQLDSPHLLNWDAGVSIPPPLLPNIRNLHFIQNRHYIRCPPLLLSPSLRHISFEDIEDEKMLSALQPIATYAPAAQVLELGPLVFDSSNSYVKWEGLLDFLRGMEHLKEVRCEMWSVKRAVLKNLVGLQDLQVLRISNDVEDLLYAVKQHQVESTENHGQQTFAALEHLQFQVKSDAKHIQMCLEFFECIQRTRLESIAIGFENGVPATRDLNELVIELGKLNSRTLKSVTLALAKDRSRPSGYRNRAISSSRPSGHSSILNVSLKNLYKCREMETFVLSLPCVLDMDDDDMKELSEAWPKLKRLQLGPKDGAVDDIPNISLYGMELLVRNCKMLNTLGLTFDARAPTTTARRGDGVQSHDVGFVPNMRIQYLDVGGSTIRKPAVEGVAKVLARLFPKLTGIGGMWLYVGGGPGYGQARNTSQLEWQQVVELVKADWSRRT
ncbi:hypothetical protein BDN72DRAFT_841782 [Pluteus cervinus]|uniref:Uncharacterized protein n=1 Tax=Pluteus cervinus TaxID=181527 RepID=A0ACD3ASF1_9AGAR|nr:hypothetical protein BDN72DRAFT_841782 [Pluteus cervinus]